MTGTNGIINGGDEFSLLNDSTKTIPIFLRKTYLMIETCDPALCSWSEDGESFFVKDPQKFEREVIPQYFKHSKFSSFVRQLNFYSFRKIRTNDTVRIDPALEAATRNHWRFYHPKFRRGRPDWLKEIKRSPSSTTTQQQQQKRGGGRGSGVNNRHNNKESSLAAAMPTRFSLEKALVGRQETEENDSPRRPVPLEVEVGTLKERIEVMNRNIDALTAMVENVSLTAAATTSRQQQQHRSRERMTRTKTEGNISRDDNDAVSWRNEKRNSKKRCKVSSSSSTLSWSSPLASSPITRFDDVNNEVFVPDDNTGASLHSSSSELSDENFVGALFTAFREEGVASVSGEENDNYDNEKEDEDWTRMMMMDLGSDYDESDSESPGNATATTTATRNNRRNNQEREPPSAELMDRLSDALSLLPRNLQELIVDRLIHAVVCASRKTKELPRGTIPNRTSAAVATLSNDTDVICSGKMDEDNDYKIGTATERSKDDHRSSVTVVGNGNNLDSSSLPFAAATALAALLSSYGKTEQGNNGGGESIKLPLPPPSIQVNA